MPEYKVLKPGFFGSIFREPGGRHDPIVTAKPIPKAKMPSWVEEIKVKKQTASERKAAAAAVTTPNENSDNFMGEEKDVETL